MGFSVALHPMLRSARGFLAGDDPTRLRIIHDYFEAKEVDIIMAARGGYGLHRIVDRIERARMSHPKWVVGFSDVCALHAALNAQGLMSMHGPVVTQLGDLGTEDLEYFQRALTGSLAGLSYRADGPAIAPKTASGILVGGCLSVVQPLIGTDLLPWMNPSTERPILLLEEVGERPYRVDRMLTHLRAAGVFARVAGVALGDFVGCEAPDLGRPNEQDIQQVLEDRLGDLGVPVLAGLPFGHGKRNLSVPLGARVELDSEARTLKVLP